MIELLGTGLHYAWSFIVILSTIVFVHEFGHYFVAKCCGVKIDVFSIGFGRELFGFNDRSGTRWKFSLLPFGGYVKMFGDAGAASTKDSALIDTMSEADKKRSFHHKSLWQKALVVVAGPVANFILAIAIMTWFLYSNGLSSSEPIIGEIIPDTPAAAAGLKAGDRVLSVNDSEVDNFGDISRMILTNLGTPVKMDIQRKSDSMTLYVTPIEFADKDALGNDIKRPLIGIRSAKLTTENLNLLQAVGHATLKTYELSITSLHFMGQMVTGQRSAEDLKGPIGIAQISGKVTQSGDTTSETIEMILWFIAMLSVNLGIVNLLPIPMLDGGHLVYYSIEAVRGRPLAEKFQEYGYRVGFTLIACLMAFTLFNDIRQILL